MPLPGIRRGSWMPCCGKNINGSRIGETCVRTSTLRLQLWEREREKIGRGRWAITFLNFGQIKCGIYDSPCWELQYIISLWHTFRVRAPTSAAELSSMGELSETSRKSRWQFWTTEPFGDLFEIKHNSTQESHNLTASTERDEQFSPVCRWINKSMANYRIGTDSLLGLTLMICESLSPRAFDRTSSPAKYCSVWYCQGILNASKIELRRRVMKIKAPGDDRLKNKGIHEST